MGQGYLKLFNPITLDQQIIPGPPVPPIPPTPIPFVPGLQRDSIDGPGGHATRGAQYKALPDEKPFPMEHQKQRLEGFKPKRMGFKARKTKPPFRPMS